MLEEQYTENVAVAMVDGDPVNSWEYVGWLNYLFNEKNHIKNFDTWKLFEAFYYSNNEYNSWNDWLKWNGFGTTRYAFISSCEIYAVIYGVDKAVKRFDTAKKGEREEVAFAGMKVAMEFLQQYAKEKQNINEQQCREMMNIIRLYYIKEEREDLVGLYEGKYEKLVNALMVSDAPAFVVKGISEIFHKDFWELWGEVKDVAQRKRNVLYGNDGYYVVPVSTTDFFQQQPDDMIFYWEDDNRIIFSEELWEWFGSLRKLLQYLCIH